jgi:iron complex outermembrane recepter protein
MSTKQQTSNSRRISKRMETDPRRNSHLAMAVRAALAGTTLVQLVGVAKAQDVAAAPAASDTTLAEVVVTGSRIAVPNQTSISPVTFISSAAIQQSGVTRVEDLLNQLPQVFADQSSTASNGSDGTASVNLRGLNSKRTLVLVNGQRLGPGDPTTGAQSDINIIPIEMIDSVEVLTGGASSVYGADAVAGVVNFKLNDHFEGVKIVANGGIYQNHNRDVQGANEALAASGDAEAPSNVWTGAQRSLAVIAGLNSADNNGNATFYATYRNVLPILESKYDWSACALASGFMGTGGGPTGSGGINGKFACGGSEVGSPTTFINANTGATTHVGPGGSLLPGPALYNYGPLNYFQRPDERYTAGAFLHYDFNEHATVYENFMYMDDRTVAQVAPSGDFNTSGAFNCSNPFLSADQLGLLCGGSKTGTTNPAIYILRRNVEGGGRQNAIEHTDFREVLGVKGKIDDVWSYDASFNYSLVNLNNDNLNFFSTAKLTNALTVTGTAANPSCVVGPPCVPYNIFQPGGVSQAALAYLYAPGLEVGRITQTDVIANFTGDLEKYGLKLPTANTGLKVNLGAEYRDTTSALLPDEELQSGDLSGEGGAVTPIAGGVIAREGFVEANMPLIDDMPAAQAVDLDAGYRYSSYNLGFKTNTFKLGLEWSPIQEIRLRGSLARAVRAPNVVELYEPGVVNLDSSYAVDPCAGSKPVYSAAQCAKTGVIVSPNPAINQYGNIAPNAAGQYNGLLGGNPDLQPETAITASFGIGWTPAYIPNFRAQVDYYDIHIENVIQGTGGTVILTECATQGIYCNFIHRDTSNGSLWLSESGFISDLNVNDAGLREKGVDVDIAYSYDVGAFGKLHANLVGTYISQYDEIPSQIYANFAYNCAGLYGPSCSSPTTGAGNPVFRWRHRFTTTWETPWSGLDVTLAWRYYSPVRLESLSPNPNLAAPNGGTVANGAISNTDAYISSYSYFDLTAAVKIADKLTMRVGCNNLLDKAPPLVGATNIAAPPTGNGNTFPGVYDSLGRYIFAELTAQF